MPRPNRHISSARRRRASRYARSLVARYGTQAGRAHHLSPRMLATQDLRRRRQHGQRVTSLARLFGIVAIFFTTLTLGFLLMGAGVTMAAWNYFTTDLPAIDQFEVHQFETTKIFDRNGQLLYEVNDPQTGWRTYLSLDQITATNSNSYLVNAT